MHLKVSAPRAYSFFGEVVAFASFL
ncbi:hypothetical protein TorRG33x02_055170 [Trema orientale]|uniref:Uncharacterized protein n=1 Tax=Trema orientale TaxID=63057 RepID=A0A2P5FLE1_TREOI|nr:hypothetical protein TorRG33x02_055170 [Trema orientale]